MIQLHNTDCIQFLQTLESGNVDMVVADPPYSSGGAMRSDRNGTTKAKYTRSDSQNIGKLLDFEGDNRDQRAYLYWSQLWMSEAVRVLKPGGLLLVFTDWRQLPITTDAVQAAGAVWRGIVPWHKQASRPMADRFTSSCEYIVWCTNGPREVNMKDKGAKYPEGFYNYRPPANRIHVTQKPVDLYRHIFQILRPNSIIVDPFLGSGNSAVACHVENAGHTFHGCELSESVFEVAQKAVANLTVQTSIPMQ